MLTRRLLILSWLILPMGSAAFADERSWKRQRQVLFDQLRNAGTEREARRVEDAIWRMWMANAPTSATAEAVTEAMKKRERYDWDGALELLDEATASAPDYAEVWNQRAFVRFLKQDLDGSLEDIDRAIRLEPNHFAALAGKALILIQQGRVELGQTALREAVRLNPWLRERSMLIPRPGEILPGPGKDI